MRNVIRCLIVLFGVLTTLGLQAEIRGVVMTRDGLPLAGARVTVHALESSSARQARLLSEEAERVALVTGETTRDGSFSLEDDAVGVTVMIQKDGFAPFAVRMLKDEDVGAVPLRRAAVKTALVRGPKGVVSGARVVWSSRSGADWSRSRTTRESTRCPTRWSGPRV